MMPDLLHTLLPLVKVWPALPHEPVPKLVEFFHYTTEHSKSIPVKFSLTDCQHLVDNFLKPAMMFGGEPLFHHKVLSELAVLRDPQNAFTNDRHTTFAISRMFAFQTAAGRQMLQDMFKKMDEPPEWASEYYLYKDVEALASLAATSFAISRDKVIADHNDIIQNHLHTFMANKTKPLCAYYDQNTPWRSLY
jgi:hypothetical protein